jgi:isopenicillin N synthase-like dioxygenase
MAPPALPVVDLARYRGAAGERRAFVEQLRRATHDVGFCYLTGHGVDRELNDGALEVARRFFALPDAERMAIANTRSPQFRGYTELGHEHTNGRPDRRDQVDIGPELPAPAIGPGEPDWLRLRGPNLWPPSLPAFRTVFTAWMAALEGVGRTVLSAVAEVLGQPAGHFDTTLEPHPEVRVKVIHYPAPPASIRPDSRAQPDEPDDQGVGAHRDSGFLTFIHQDDVGGLQVELDGRFVDVAPVPGAFVLNLGEMLQLVSHGYLRATPHRVLSPPAGRERFSVAYFFNPAYEATLQPVRLPAELAAAAPGGESTEPDNPILASYGANALKVRLRTHPDVAAIHHRDLLAANVVSA